MTYQLSGGVLRRTVECWDGSGWNPEYADQVVAVNLVGPQALFRFFEGDGDEIVPAGAELTAAERARVRSVSVAMHFLNPDEPMVGTDHRAFDLEGRVHLPNVN